MIADAFLQAQTRGHPETGGEINAGGLNAIGIEFAVAQDGRSGACRFQFMSHGSETSTGLRFNPAMQSKVGGRHNPNFAEMIAHQRYRLCRTDPVEF